MNKVCLPIFFLIFVAAIANAQMGPGDMGQGMAGMMLLSGGQPYRADGKTLQMEDAIVIAQSYLLNSHGTSLALDEVEEWEYNYYVIVKEASPSNYKAYQLVIDKWTGRVQFEPGANMMWNTKYCLNNMMRMCQNQNPQRITSATATQAANQFLKQHFPSLGLVVAPGEPDLFYGFYEFDVKNAKSGTQWGMLSVNWNSGQVWYHTWHGRFMRKREL